MGSASPDGASVVFMGLSAIGRNDLALLETLPFNDRGTRRICMHSDESAELHVMLVEAKSNSRFPAHMHNDSAEVMVFVSGSMEIHIWNSGLDSQPVKENLSQDGSAIVLIPKQTFHSTSPGPDGCIYMEVKRGPFNESALVFRE